MDKEKAWISKRKDLELKVLKYQCKSVCPSINNQYVILADHCDTENELSMARFNK